MVCRRFPRVLRSGGFKMGLLNFMEENPVCTIMLAAIAGLTIVLSVEAIASIFVSLRKDK